MFAAFGCALFESGALPTIMATSAVLGFNQNYVDLLKAIKAAGACRGAIKRHYRKFDHEDAGHVARWTEWTAPFVERFLEDAGAALADASLLEDTRVFEEIYLEQVVAALPRHALVQYLYALAAMARLHETGADDAAVAAVRKHMVFLDEDVDAPLDDVADERVRVIVLAARAAVAARKSPPEVPDLPPEVAEQMRKLENTKIGRMAREISSTLGPETLADPAGLAAVIGKVGGIMQAKMRAGELDHGELLGEAMGMIGSLPSLFGAAGAGGAAGGAGGMDGLADMLKGMMGAFGGAPAKAAAAAAAASHACESHGNSKERSRLAAKLAKRRSEGSDSVQVTSVYT